MSNKIYLNKENISSVTSHSKRFFKKIYSRNFRHNFFGIKYGKEYTLYGTFYFFKKYDGYSSKEDVLENQSIYFKEQEKFFDYKDGAFSLDDNIIYLNAYVKIHTNDGKTFIKFFKNEKDMENYINDLEIQKRLCALEYDG